MHFKNDSAKPALTPLRKVLVVDDALQLSEIVASNLQAAGYEVAVANDGESALAMARKFDPDVVLLDLKMPGLDGFEVCRVLREMGGKERPKILVMSSGGSKVKEEVEQLLKDSLADGFLPKPFPIKELLPKVSSLLTQLSSTSPQ